MKYILGLFAFFYLGVGYAVSNKVYVDVNGLVCDFCAQALEKVFKKQDAVSGIKVDLDNKVVSVDFKDGKSLSDKKLTKLIQDAGYSVVAVRRDKLKASKAKPAASSSSKNKAKLKK